MFIKEKFYAHYVQHVEISRIPRYWSNASLRYEDSHVGMSPLVQCTDVVASHLERSA
jgi:hypothetical protein